jgi:hypothetical protein
VYSGKDIGSLSVNINLAPVLVSALNSRLTVDAPIIAGDSLPFNIVFIAKDASNVPIRGLTSTGYKYRISQDMNTVGAPLSRATETAPGRYEMSFAYGYAPDGTYYLRFENTLMTQLSITIGRIHLKSITSRSHDFSLDAGFPETAFQGASFDINTDRDTAMLNWSSSASWVTVSSSGSVKITGTPPKGQTEATITAVPRNGKGQLSYKFVVQRWYEYAPGSSGPTAGQCPNGYSVANPPEVTFGANVRGIGRYWGEWGNFLGSENLWLTPGGQWAGLLNVLSIRDGTILVRGQGLETNRTLCRRD